MHVAKVILLLLLTLAVMRVASWSLGWLLKRLTGAKRLWIALLSNTAALIAFAGVLVTQRIPGELIDLPALTFGVVVFTTYTLIDIRWTNWRKKKEFTDGTTS
jgi:hypothetical protein